MHQVITSLRRAVSQPAFVIVATLLIIAAAGLEGATAYMKLHFRKMPVPLARPLIEIPRELGSWRQISIDEPLAHDMQEALATDKYVFRLFADTRIIGEDRAKKLSEELLEYRGKFEEYQEAMKKHLEAPNSTPKPHPPQNLLGMLRAQHPTAFVDASVTYYTGLVDTVAHVAERCYVADGFEPSVTADVKWDVLKDRPGTGMVRYVNFEDTTQERNSFTRNVAYVFQCNGEYNSDSIAVRKRLADLRERYGYYMKVEVQTFNLSQPDASRVMNDFLSNLLPESEKCLTDWSTLTSVAAR